MWFALNPEKSLHLNYWPGTREERETNYERLDFSEINTLRKNNDNYESTSFATGLYFKFSPNSP